MSIQQQRELRRLLSKLIDGIATEEDVAHLSDVLRENVSLQDELVNFMQREAALDELHCRDLLASAFDFEDSRSLPPGEAIAAGSVLAADKHAKAQGKIVQTNSTIIEYCRNLQSKLNPSVVWAVAASLAVALTATLLWPSSHASLLATDNVLWTDGQHYQSGDPLGKDWISFESGSIQLAFGSSATMKIEGPARFRTISDGYCELQVGSALVYVPAAAKGFTVVTPQMRVVDLGTSFRVTVSKDSHNSLQVLEGTVEANAKLSGEVKTLLASDVATIAQEDGNQTLSVSDSDRISPITTKRIAFRAKHVPSLGINGFKGNNRCYVFLERYNIALPHELAVNHTAVGTHTQFSNAGGKIPLGTNVDCYLVHCAPQVKRHIVDGQITFPGKILGVITSSDKLNATNDLFGSPWSLQCNHPERGLEGTPNVNADHLQISRDRHTLKIAMRTESIDQLRVLVSTLADLE